METKKIFLSGHFIWLFMTPKSPLSSGGGVNKVLYGEAPPRRPTQANTFNTGNEGAIGNVRINRVSILTGSCYSSKKDTFY